MRLGVPQFIRNPIFERDFVSYCMTRRWFVLRTLLVAVLVLVFWLNIVGEDRVNESYGPMLFGFAAFVQVSFLLLATPALVFDLVLGERRKDRLDILLTTPVRPSGIVLGKLLARLSLLFVIVAAAFPVVSVSLLFGGVRAGQVMGLLVVSLGTVFFAAGPALLASSLARRLGTAAILSYVIPLTWCALTPILFAFYDAFGDPTLVFSTINPMGAVASVSIPDLYLPNSPHLMRPEYMFLAFSAVLAAVSTVIAIRGLRHDRSLSAAPPPDAPEPPPLPARPEGVPELLAGRLASLHAVREAAPPPATGRKSRTRNFRNPVLWKELHLHGAGHSRALFRVVLVLLALSEALFLMAAPGSVLLESPVAHVMLVAGECFLLFVVVAVNAATAVIAERDQGTLDLLQVTTLKPKEIVIGKSAGALRSAGPLLLVPLAHALVFTVFGAIHPVAFCVFVCAAIALVLFFTMFGLRASIRASTATRAILHSVGLLFVLVVILPFVVGMIGGILDADALMRFLLPGTPVLTVSFPLFLFNKDVTDFLAVEILVSTGVWIAVYFIAAYVLFASLPRLYWRTLRESGR